MSKRLVIEIRKNNKILANAYYKYAATTVEALELTSTILNYILDDTIFIQGLIE